MSVLYQKRPNDGSAIVWDYITKKYGKIEILQFNPNCCGPHNWVAKVDGKMISVDMAEVKGERNKT